MKFDDALAIVLQWEGSDYTDHPNDPGGATRWGVTQKTLADWRGAPVTKEDVRALTLQEASTIYEARYWNKCRCGELPSGLDLMVFDASVNQGPTRAVQFLQQAVGVTMDGILGPKTIAAAQAADPLKTVQETAVRRAVHYAGLQADFRLGWYRRLFAVARSAFAAV